MALVGLLACAFVYLLSTIVASVITAPFINALEAAAAEQGHDQAFGAAIGFSVAASLAPALDGSYWWVGLLIVLLFFFVLTVGATLLIPVMRGLQEDRIVILFGTCAFFAFAIWRSDPIQDGWDSVTDAAEVSNAFTVINLGAAIMLLAVQLIGAVGALTLPLARRSAFAPRLGPGAVLGRYATQGRRLWDGMVLLGVGLLQVVLRCLLIAVLGACSIFAWLAWIAPSIGIDEGDWLIFSPVVVANGSVAMLLLWEALTLKGARAIPVLLLVGLAQGLLISALSVTQPFGSGFREGAIEQIGFATLVPILILCRGFYMPPFRASVERLRSQLILSATETVEKRGKAPVLLLRSFADDQVEVPKTVRSVSYFFGDKNFTRRLEEVIAETLIVRGPIIAAADPAGVEPPPLGAAREALPHTVWQDYITQQIRDSQLIVCVIGETPSFRWELEKILALNALQKTIFVVGPGYPDTRSLHHAHPAVAQAIGLKSPEDEKGRYRRARVFAFSPKAGRWQALTALMGNERSFAEAIRIGASYALEGAKP